jgi:hypothetical protein
VAYAGINIDTKEMREKRIKELRAELRQYDYVAMPRDHVRVFGAQHEVSAAAAHMYGKDDRYMESVRRDLGANLGIAILQSGAIRLRDFTSGIDNRTFQLTTQIILDDPNFDAPPQWQGINR